MKQSRSPEDARKRMIRAVAESMVLSGERLVSSCERARDGFEEDGAHLSDALFRSRSSEHALDRSEKLADIQVRCIRRLEEQAILHQAEAENLRAEKQQLRRKLAASQRSLKERSEAQAQVEVARHMKENDRLQERAAKAEHANSAKKAKTESFALQLQESRHRHELTRDKLGQETKKSRELKRALRDLQHRLQTSETQRLVTRQRAVLFRNRAKALEESASTEVVREVYEEKLRVLAVGFQKEKRQLLVESQRTMLKREEALRAQYEKIAGAAIDSSRKSTTEFLKRERSSNSQLSAELVALRARSVPIELHDSLVQEATLRADEARRAAQAAEARKNEVLCAARGATEEVVLLKARLQQASQGHERRDAASASSVQLLERRLHDKDELLSESRLTVDKLEAKVRVAAKRLAEEEERRRALHEATQLLKKDLAHLTEKRVGEASAQAHKARELEGQALTLQGALHSKKEDRRRERADELAAADQLKAELLATKQALQGLTVQNQDLQETVQSLLPEIERARAKQDRADQQTEAVQGQAAGLVRKAKQAFARAERKLELERAAHVETRQELLDAQETEAAGRRAAEEALEVARREHQHVESELRIQVEKLGADRKRLKEQHDRYRVLMDNIEKSLHTRQRQQKAAAAAQKQIPNRKTKKKSSANVEAKTIDQEEEEEKT